MAVNLTGTWNFDIAASSDPELVASIEGFDSSMLKKINSVTSITLKIVHNDKDFDLVVDSELKSDHIHATIGAPPIERLIDGILNKVNLFYDDDDKVLVEQHRFTDAKGRRVIRAHRRFLEDDGNTLTQHTFADIDGESVECRRIFRKAH